MTTIKYMKQKWDIWFQILHSQFDRFQPISGFSELLKFGDLTNFDDEKHKQ